MWCKIRVIREIDVFPKYRPKVGKVYDAEYSPRRGKVYKQQYSGKGEFCIIDILDKRIVLRKGEFELVGVQT